MAVNSYRDLKVWQIGMDLAQEVYTLTRTFPKHELFGLCNQMQRSAASIPANIAEGNARDSTKEYLHHLSVAQGSLAELETFLSLAERLGYVDRNCRDVLLHKCAEEGKMLSGLQKSLRNRLQDPR